MNPPFLGFRHYSPPRHLVDAYGELSNDLFACFVGMATELTSPPHRVAFVAPRLWMFVSTHGPLRSLLSSRNLMRSCCDVHFGAFSEAKDVSVSLSTLAESSSNEVSFLRPVPAESIRRDADQIFRNIAGLLSQGETFTVSTVEFRRIETSPFVYWWSSSLRSQYALSPKIGDASEVRQGLATSDNVRFLRLPHEQRQVSEYRIRHISDDPLAVERHFRGDQTHLWIPYIKGAAGQVWIEPLRFLVNWARRGLEIKRCELGGKVLSRPQNEAFYFRPAVAVSAAGRQVSSRAHRYRSVFDVMGQSVLGISVPSALVSLNSRVARTVLESLNPSIHFQVGDILRVPVIPVDGSHTIFAKVEEAFGRHESHREPSVEFKRPGPSPWRHAQEWAQIAVDRAEGAPLPPYAPVEDPEPPTDHVSYALGCALGRFGREGEGILDPGTADLSDTSTRGTLPSGILFLDGTLDPGDRQDSLGQPPAAQLHHAWDQHGAAIAPGTSLRDYLRIEFFAVHKRVLTRQPT